MSLYGRKASLLLLALAALTIEARATEIRTLTLDLSAAPQPAMTAEPACRALVAEIDKYLKGSVVKAALALSEPEESSVAQIALTPGVLTVIGSPAKGEEKAQPFDSKTGAIETCAEAISEEGETKGALIILEPPPTEEVKNLIDRTFRWGIVNGEVRWTIGEPLDISFVEPLNATFKSLPFDPPNTSEKASSTRADELSPNGEDGTTDGTSGSVGQATPQFSGEPQGKTEIAISQSTPSLFRLENALSAVLYGVAFLSLLALTRSAWIQRRHAENAFLTFVQNNAAKEDTDHQDKEDMMKLLRKIERQMFLLGRVIEGLPSEILGSDPAENFASHSSSSAKIDGLDPPPRPRQPLRSETAVHEIQMQPLATRLHRVNLDAIVRNFNELISVNGSADEFADANKLVLFVGDRATQTLKPYDGQPDAQSPMFWVGLDEEGCAFALPGPDVVKSSTNPAVPREKLRGFFQTEQGSHQLIWVDKPARLEERKDGAAKVVSRGRLLLRY